MFFADTISMGSLIGLPIAALIVLVCLAIAIFGAMNRRYDEPGERFGLWFMIGGTLSALIVVAIVGVLMWPWKHDYHFWVDKGGVVEQVSKRLVPAGEKSMQEKYVFVIDGRPYGVLDTRAALVKVGDRVDIACKRAFEWGVPQSANGWDCKWRGAVD